MCRVVVGPVASTLILISTWTESLCSSNCDQWWHYFSVQPSGSYPNPAEKHL